MISSLQQKHGGTDSSGMLPFPFDRQSNMKFTKICVLADAEKFRTAFLRLGVKDLDLKSETI